ncbi:MAG: hypothetical protein HZC43_13030 [Nitrosomonadales bacterium]|nr:hypothetical protein [Nitrosomonadales bacterium]
MSRAVTGTAKFCPRRQRGAALMVMLVIVVMGIAAALVGSLSATALKTAHQETTAAALAQAKEALIGRAASDDNMPGSLPCPDTNNDGSAEMLSGNECPIYIGRLPWRTLKLPDLRDGGGERLWYALSGNFRDDNSARPLNSNTQGQFTVKDAPGNTLATGVVAIIFAPGEITYGQSRGGADANIAANFLEGENANGDSIFVSGQTTDTFNDRMTAISGDSLWPTVEKVVGKRFRGLPLLGTYYAASGAFPFAAPFTDPSLSFTNSSRPFIGAASVYSGLLPMGATWAGIPAYSIVGGSADVACELRDGYNDLVNARARCNISNISDAPVISITGTLTGLRLWRPHNLSDANQVRVRVNGISYSAASVAGMGAAIGYTMNTNGSVTVAFTGRLFSGVERIELRDVVVDPSVDPVDPAYAWFTRNQWNQVMYYAVSPGYAPGGGNACTPPPGIPSCLTVNGGDGGNDKRVVIVMAGGALSGQSHPSSGIAGYLEDGNVTPADFIYENKARTGSFNDQVIVVAP